MAAAPSIGRASAVEAPPVAREAELTGALYERYSSQIYGFCLHKLGSREEAEDAVQTTFLNAFRGYARGVEPQAESAWLFKIAENVCLSRHRSSFRRRRVESPSDLEALQDILPGHEPEKDELHGLERVLERLPETQRRAILLREWQGLSYREISDEMGITQAAVETLIFRARRALAQGLGNVEREPLRRRVRRSIDAGSVVAVLKTFLGSAAAMKTAATVVAVTSATVVAVTPSPLRHHVTRQPQRPARSPATARPATRAGASAPVVPGVAQRSAPARVVAAHHAHGSAVTRHPVAPMPVLAAPASARHPGVIAPARTAPPPVETPAAAPQPQADASQALAAPAASQPPGSKSKGPQSGAVSDRGSRQGHQKEGQHAGGSGAQAPAAPTGKGKGDGHGKKDRHGGNGSQPKRTGAAAQPGPPAAQAVTPPAAPAPADAPATEAAPPASDSSGSQPPAQGTAGQPGSGGYETVGKDRSRNSRSEDR